MKNRGKGLSIKGKTRFLFGLGAAILGFNCEDLSAGQKELEDFCYEAKKVVSVSAGEIKSVSIGAGSAQRRTAFSFLNQTDDPQDTRTTKSEDEKKGKQARKEELEFEGLKAQVEKIRAREPLVSWLQRTGCVVPTSDKSFRVSKTLTTSLNLTRLLLPALGDSRTVTLDLSKLLPESCELCAVQVLKGASLAPDEGDDGAAGPRVRSLPLGVLKRRQKNGAFQLRIQVVPPENAEQRADVQVAIFCPAQGEEATNWWALKLSFFTPEETEALKTLVTSAEMDTARAAYLKRFRNAALSSGVPGFINNATLNLIFSQESDDEDEKGLRVLLREVGKTEFEEKLSDNGCPHWAAFLKELAETNAGSLIRGAPRPAGFPSERGYTRLDELAGKLEGLEGSARYLHESWHEPMGAFCQVLGVPDPEDADARMRFEGQYIAPMRRAYIRLAVEHRKSPEQAHCLLMLYLSMAPWKSHEFLEGVCLSVSERGAAMVQGDDFVLRFFQESGLAELLVQYPDGGLNEDLVNRCWAKIEDELNGWKEKFEQEKQRVFTKKKGNAEKWIMSRHSHMLGDCSDYIDDSGLFKCYADSFGVMPWIEQETRIWIPPVVPNDWRTRFGSSYEAVIWFAHCLFGKGKHLRSPSWGLDMPAVSNWDADSPRSHVNYPACLWQRLPVNRWQDWLKSFFPDAWEFVDTIKSRVFDDWVKEGSSWNFTNGHWWTDVRAANQSLISRSAYVARDLYDEVRLRGALDLLGEFSVRINGMPLKIYSEAIVCAMLLGKFVKSVDSGLRCLCALGELLHRVRQLESQGAGTPGHSDHAEYERLFGPIRRATGAKNFQSFLADDAFQRFVWNAIDNPVEEGRCLDGAYAAFCRAIPLIVRMEKPDVGAVYLWAEESLQRYIGGWLEIFNHEYGNHEELTYGPPFLRHKVNPILGEPHEPIPVYRFAHMEGRRAIEDFLIPLKTGVFPASSDEANGIFYCGGNRMHSSRVSEDEYRFSYITPFSPIKIFYHDARELCRRRLAPGRTEGERELDKLSFDERLQMKDILHLAFTVEPARREFLGFVAPVGDGVGRSGGQDSAALSYAAVCTGDPKSVSRRISEFNKHARYWKLGYENNQVFWYPSLELWKKLTVELGYAFEKDGGGQPTDLATYDYQPPTPKFGRFHGNPGSGGTVDPEESLVNNLARMRNVPGNPGTSLFFKHFNDFWERNEGDWELDSPGEGDKLKRLKVAKEEKVRALNQLMAVPEEDAVVSAKLNELGLRSIDILDTREARKAKLRELYRDFVAIAQIGSIEELRRWLADRGRNDFVWEMYFLPTGREIALAQVGFSNRGVMRRLMEDYQRMSEEKKVAEKAYEDELKKHYRSPLHPRNAGDKRALPEPEKFSFCWDGQQVVDYGGEQQKLLYRLAYPDGQGMEGEDRNRFRAELGELQKNLENLRQMEADLPEWESRSGVANEMAKDLSTWNTIAHGVHWETGAELVTDEEWMEATVISDAFIDKYGNMDALREQLNTARAQEREISQKYCLASGVGGSMYVALGGSMIIAGPERLREFIATFVSTHGSREHLEGRIKELKARLEGRRRESPARGQRNVSTDGGPGGGSPVRGQRIVSTGNRGAAPEEEAPGDLGEVTTLRVVPVDNHGFLLDSDGHVVISQRLDVFDSAGDKRDPTSLRSFLERLGCVIYGPSGTRLHAFGAHRKDFLLENPQARRVNFDWENLVKMRNERAVPEGVPYVVFVFGDGTLAPSMCDDLATEGPRVRSLPQGIIVKKASGERRMVELNLSPNWKEVCVFVYESPRDSRDRPCLHFAFLHPGSSLSVSAFPRECVLDTTSIASWTDEEILREWAAVEWVIKNGNFQEPPYPLDFYRCVRRIQKKGHTRDGLETIYKGRIFSEAKRRSIGGRDIVGQLDPPPSAWHRSRLNQR
ncbi:MAG: hypothetical protein LBD54_02680 [Puniceicoccales bacterium]|jgi:hypothetical protein|nr:hypothetical protein [Puniceicoccales bacterium]